MIKVNENYFNLEESYLFSTIAKKVNEYQIKNPNKKVIKLGIGDVTLPLIPEVVKAMKKAIEEMGQKETFRGYGPEQGYDFLREKIAKYDYQDKGIDIDLDEIFVSDGAKCDTGNITEIFSKNNKVAITDPVYPVYLDTNIMCGRINKEKPVVYLPCTKENNFMPELPKEHVDIIYLCSPNNPTGATMTKGELKKWVEYAKNNKSIILYDAAYERFIQDQNTVHSIFEIEGAKETAIEFKSYSKTAGFTGVRCGYVVIPKEVKAYKENGEEVEVRKMWNRRQCTKFNGTPYITQRGAEAIYTERGRKEIDKNIEYYRENAKIIKEGLEEAGFNVYGGIDSPYIWLEVPNGKSSWEFFDELLENVNIVGTPGVGFGKCGEGFFRLTAFGDRENTIEAIDRIKKYYKK